MNETDSDENRMESMRLLDISIRSYREQRYNLELLLETAPVSLFPSLSLFLSLFLSFSLSSSISLSLSFSLLIQFLLNSSLNFFSFNFNLFSFREIQDIQII